MELVSKFSKLSNKPFLQLELPKIKFLQPVVGSKIGENDFYNFIEILRVPIKEQRTSIVWLGETPNNKSSK
jgi:hypothetical protein